MHGYICRVFTLHKASLCHIVGKRADSRRDEERQNLHVQYNLQLLAETDLFTARDESGRPAG